MVARLLVGLLLVLLMWTASSVSLEISKRSVRNSLADVLGIKSGNKKKKAPVKITPPLRLKPGETAEQAPGWQHCIKNLRATLTWKNIKSPGYPDFLESQIQCSWIIEAPIGMRVKVAFRDLDMVGTTGSCAKQFAQIIDISTGKSQGRFCGGSRPGDYVTLGTKVRLDLQADKAVTKSRGFLISFVAVKEIPGFRSTKTFQSVGAKHSTSTGGKINLKNFLSSSSDDGPKNTPGAKRANKRLVYESDRNPPSTDSSGGPTESAVAADPLDEDPGWIGDDSGIQNRNTAPRAPNGGPLKVRPGGNRQRSPGPTNNGPIIITASTLPVRIRAKNPTTSPPPSAEKKNEGPIIYGADNQPYDPNDYTTLHPVRRNNERFVDHRPEFLSETNLIIIVACGGMFGVIIVAIILFICFYRKRRRKRRKKKKREIEKKKKEEQNKASNIELKVVNLEDGSQQNLERQRELPNFPPRRDSPPCYPDRHEFSYPQDGAIERQDVSVLNSHERSGLPTISRHGMPPMGYPRDDPRRHEYSPRDVRPYPPVERFPERPARHQTEDPRRYQSRMPTSQMRHHHTLDVRNLERDHPIDRRHVEFRGTDYPRLPPNYSRNSPKYRNGEYPRGDTRIRNSGVADVDEDYCSADSEDSGSGKATMRREYSPWEVEQQKKERRHRLISGTFEKF